MPQPIWAAENARNARSFALYRSIIREAYGADEVCAAHHLIFTKFEGETRHVEELPSADTLIFDHGVARKIWGDDWQSMLTRLALEPTETRDKLLGELYASRQRTEQP
ncbi:hypothetical protein CWO91_16670 [Bradyrhizobium genosp. SA-3]|uniref:hypothetical protein n=1 Tax=Bradyrhizobium genosp. SA-3 TaxID=508868 RepID=UPI001029745B|nr:hypothetical protein [Bradyrhizobium genosp. SA-3]RZN09661.1 hypothetical protein CWO91_16670 [Bradyrhizobium genosp. SA-3]